MTATPAVDLLGDAVGETPTKRSFADRCNIAAGCLPRSDYRTQLERLHTEMLDVIEQLRDALLVGHIYADGCPLPASPDDRDSECPACCVLMGMTADQLTADQLISRCPCGYPMPCAEKVPITFCRAYRIEQKPTANEGQADRMVRAPHPERAEFEAWWCKAYHQSALRNFTDGCYMDARAGMAWDAWQAAQARLL